MHLYKSLSTFAIAILGAVALIGCGESEEDAVAKKVAAREDTARVRIINLTDKAVAFDWLGREIEGNIQPLGASSFRNIGTQEKEIVVRQGSEVIATVTFEAEPAGLFNIIVIGSGDDIRYVEFPSSEMAAQSNANFEAVFIDESGNKTSGSMTMTGSEGNYDLDGNSGQMQIALGDYKLEGLTAMAGGQIEDDSYYTVFVVETRDGKRIGMLLRNALMDKPVVGGDG